MEIRNVALQSSCLSPETSSANIQPFVYTQFKKQWIHIRTEATEKLPKVTHVCLVLIASDFNVSLYSSLSQILLARYINSSSPVPVLETFLQAITRGHCLSEDNGTINVQDFDVTRHALSDSNVKSVVGMFGIEFIIVFTALLLKKRIVVYHTDIAELASICRTLPAFVWHRLTWNNVFPLVHLSTAMVDDLQTVGGGYIAGFTNIAVETRTDLYDVFVNARSQEITIAAHAKESFAMGKLHKELATFIVQCTQNEATSSDAQCIKAIAARTQELVKNLKSLGCDDGSGRTVVTAQALLQKQLPASTENFLLGLASAEGILQLTE